MFKLIGIILLVIFILCNLKKILGFIMQCIVAYIGFIIHPFLGIFLAFCFIASWFGGDKIKEEPKQEEKKSSSQNNHKQNTNNNQRQQYQKSNNQQQYQQRPRQQTQSNSFSYFAGCTTKEQLKKRHRELCMKYHPDRGGNAEVFKKMQAEYESIKVKFN